MSGTPPGKWFKKGKTVNYKGKKEIMKDYFFTSAGCHNCDTLNILFESGRSVEAFSKDFQDENPGLVQWATWEDIIKNRK